MSLANIETHITEADVDASIARVIHHAESIWDEWAWQVENQTWLIKGYSSWDEMRQAVYTNLNGVTAPRKERPELVARFRGAGLTQKQTADTLGVSQRTVSNHDKPRQEHPSRSSNFATSDSGDAEPEPAADEDNEIFYCGNCGGIDELSHDCPDNDEVVDGELVDDDDEPEPEPAPKPSAPPRRALTDQFFDAFYELTKASQRVERLVNDDRFPRNKEKVAAKHRSDLVRSAEALARVLDQLS